MKIILSIINSSYPVFFASILVLMHVSCKQETSRKTYQNEITSITIIDKTIYLPERETIVITGQDSISAIMKEIAKLEPFDKTTSRVGLPERNNFGFLEVEILNESTYKESLQVIYTVYNGVVILKGREPFRNDNLELLLLEYISSF